MTTPHTIDLSPSTPGLSAVPRAVWVGGGLLSLVTAGLAGALIMRAADTAPAPTTMPTAAPLVSSAAQPVPLVAPAAAPNANAGTSPAAHAAAATQHTKSTGASTTSATPAPALQGTTRAALCASCGVVESVTPVRHKGEGTGLGAVAGGVLGGVVGHQLGGGKGKTALTVLGAVGGGLAGNEVEKRARGDTRYDVQVRMEDGSTRRFERTQSMAVGTRVVVEGSTLRLARSAPKGDETPTRVLRTSAPSGSST